MSSRARITAPAKGPLEEGRRCRPFLVIALDMEERETVWYGRNAGQARMAAARQLVDVCYYETIGDVLPRLRVLSLSDRAIAVRAARLRQEEGR